LPTTREDQTLNTPAQSLPQQQASEQETREHLAACYRLVAHYGWDDLVATHISARVPGRHDQFFINTFGMMFDEITASSLVKINLDGEVVDSSDRPINQAGFVIHSAVHEARPDAGCVIHLHTRDGVAVSALEQGLYPLNQTAMTIASDIAFHEFEGVALDLDERARVQQDLGNHNLMLLRNHGTLALGQSIASAFARIYFLERACETQTRTLAMNAPIHQAPEAAVAKVAQQTAPQMLETFAVNMVWPALLRKVQRLYPDYRD